MGFPSWTVSLSFAQAGRITVTNAMKQTMMQHIAGAMPVLVAGDDYLGLTFDVRATDAESAFMIAKTTADDALCAAGLPALMLEEVNLSSERKREHDDEHIPDLVGISEIAKLAGVSKQRAWQITQLKGFPIGTKLDCGRVYQRDPVVKFIEKGTPRRPADSEPHEPRTRRSR